MNANKKTIQVGVYESIDFCIGGLGNNIVTIDGVAYLSFLDVCAPGFPRRGDRVKFSFSAGPTVLSHSPHITDNRPLLLTMVAEA